jgi:SPOR domain
MAERFFDNDGAGAPVRAVHYVHLAGGLTSAALVIWMAVWGYKLAVRNVEGIPIVRALDGPMRVAPETPGGEVADNQGLAVNDVARLGSATPLPDALTLAPRPVALAAEDGPGLGSFEPVEEPAIVPVSAPAEPGVTDTGIDVAAVDAAVAEALTPEEILAFAESDLLDASAPLRSLYPRARPGSQTARSGAQNAAPLSGVEDVLGAAVNEVDPATLALGTPLVQLGTFNTADEARLEWAKLLLRFDDLMVTKSLVLQDAKSGSSSFVRLRAAGFISEDDARRFCTALLTEDAACVPTVYR